MKREFVSRLGSMSQLMDQAWDTDSILSIEFEPLSITDHHVKFAFAALRKLKHHITIAPLSRFFDQAVKAVGDNDARAKAAKEFGEAVKATVAFSMIWRGAHGSTENIDGIYRDILRQGIEGEDISPLCARPEKGVGVVSLANYKRALRHHLTIKKIADRDAWAKRVSSVQIYKAPNVARFLLLCACHDSVPDKLVPGLIKRGRPGVNIMINIDILVKDEYFSVEHVAPQSQSQEWHPTITEEPGIVQTLGNLTLLPQDINSYLGNREWKQKKAIYALLACEDQEAFDAMTTDLNQNGFVLSQTAEEILRNASHLSLCKSISSFEAEWDVNFIKSRSVRIAELAWDTLWPWLQSDDPQT